jgi:NADH-quinone oxidoreductase subunit I
MLKGFSGGPLSLIRPFLVGFTTTLKHMFKKPVSVNYPDQKFPMFPKWRGKQVLMRDENGLEKCVACGLCAVACPADAIYLEAAENDGSVQAGPRYAKVYQIHKTRCIFCGYCEEACPVSAIFMGKDYELAVYSKDDFIWDKKDLLVPDTITAAAPGASVGTQAATAANTAAATKTAVR